MILRKLLFALFLVISGTTSAQVEFISKTFDNGLEYPFATSENKEIEDTINSQISSLISDLKDSEFCAGDFGYVQKGEYIQIHLMCACIELEESEHRYLVLDLKTGYSVPQSHLFSDSQRENALKYITTALYRYTTTNEACTDAFASLPKKIKFKDLDIRLGKYGIDVRPANSNACEKSAMQIEWNKIQQYLQFIFI